ncbi:MAG: hypothetical protein QM786_16180 [Breznakibacter sp.]
MRIHVIIRFFAIMLVVGACKGAGSDPLSEPVAGIDSKVLTKRQLQDAVPDGLSAGDSIVFAQDYINRWVRTQLMLRKAEQNLSPSEMDVEKLIEEYRTSLITYQYQQKLLEQKFAPIISDSEIEAYYREMKENFRLTRPIIKGIFIKIPLTAPKISDIEGWYRSSRPGDLVDLEAYCYQYAKKFDSFLDQWRYIDNFQSELPSPVYNPSEHFKTLRYYHTRDREFAYFLSIRDIMFEDSTAPIEFVRNDIKAILLNKKRIEYIKKLEDDIYEEGLKQKVVKFY